MRFQQTIQRAVTCQGIGVHTGAPARLHLSPAPANTGIVFVRTDFKGDGRIPARVEFVTTTNLGTTLRNAAGAEVATVEHLLAACAGLGVDNLHVAVDGPEMPILDGSSALFAELLVGAGMKQQAAPRRAIRIRDRIAVANGAKSAALEPAPRAAFDVTIRFDDPAIACSGARSNSARKPSWKKSPRRARSASWPTLIGCTPPAVAAGLR